MKDLRTPPDPRHLASLRRGGTARHGERSDEEARRLRNRHRWTAGFLIAGVLALVIAPHLLDASRISSVANRAAAQAAGARSELALTCPASGGYADAVNPPPPVTIERAVICHYFAGPVDLPPVTGDVPPAELTEFNADLQSHSRPVPADESTSATLAVPGRRAETWVVFGVTALGQRVTLTGSPFPARFTWSGAGPERAWRPSPVVQQLLAADLPS